MSGNGVCHILSIASETLDALARDYLMRRVHTMLVERSPDPSLRALLDSYAHCRDFWHPHYQAMAGMTEHGIAVRLAYLLAARVHRLNPALAEQRGDDADIAMKARLEEKGVLPFAAFD